MYEPYPVIEIARHVVELGQREKGLDQYAITQLFWT
jgi:hypothetical protein